MTKSFRATYTTIYNTERSEFFKVDIPKSEEGNPTSYAGRVFIKNAIRNNSLFAHLVDRPDAIVEVLD